MSRFTANGATGPGSDYWTALDNRPDPVPTAPPFDRAALERARATCVHGPYYADAASGLTCAVCGACVPGGWTWRCLRGWVR